MRRALRIATVFVPPILAGAIALSADQGRLDVVGCLVFAWIVMTVALVMRFREARRFEHLDVLTGTGRAMMWTGLLAVAASTVTGWASLSVVGVLGIGTTCVAVTWTAIVAGGDLPWRGAKVVRAVLPRDATEGDPLREEIALSNVTIPAGMRLFVQGRALRHGVTTRYVVGAEGGGADLELASDLGPAPRGAHQIPPLALWLGDVIGLTRTPIAHLGATELSVMPRVRAVAGARDLLGTGGDDDRSMPTQRLPTEGTFRIREYHAGDDARRIHWVRSLQAQQLVVRLPDEIPNAEPAVRLVLDTHLEGTSTVTTPAADELFDAMVRVWLGVGQALADAGTRVTLATAVADADGAIVPVEQVLHARPSRAVLRLGTRVAWQATVGLPALLASGVKQIVVTCRPQQATTPDLVHIVVPERAWTTTMEWPLDHTTWYQLPFPMGSEENRRTRRQHERRRQISAWDDRWRFSGLVGAIDWQACAGSYVARPADDRVSLEVVS